MSRRQSNISHFGPFLDYLRAPWALGECLVGFRTPHRCLHAIAPMPLIYKALERFREVKQRLYFVLERSGSGSASGLQACPTAPRTAARSCRPALLPRASRRAYPVLHSSALVLSLPSAGAQGLSARRTFRTRTSAPCALQCKHSRLASALNWRLACPTFSAGLAVAPLRVGAVSYTHLTLPTNREV